MLSLDESELTAFLRSIPPASRPALLCELRDHKTPLERAETSLHEFVKQAWPHVESRVDFVDNWHIAALLPPPRSGHARRNPATLDQRPARLHEEPAVRRLLAGLGLGPLPTAGHAVAVHLLRAAPLHARRRPRPPPDRKHVVPGTRGAMSSRSSTTRTRKCVTRPTAAAGASRPRTEASARASIPTCSSPTISSTPSSATATSPGRTASTGGTARRRPAASPATSAAWPSASGSTKRIFRVISSPKEAGTTSASRWNSNRAACRRPRSAGPTRAPSRANCCGRRSSAKTASATSPASSARTARPASSSKTRPPAKANSSSARGSRRSTSTNCR